MSETAPNDQFARDLASLSGRHPILDRKDQLVAYELDVNTGPGGGRQRFEIARRLLDHASFATAKTIFFRVDPSDLAAGHHHLLPASRVVLCVPASGRALDKFIDAYAHLAAKGYTLALDGIGSGAGSTENTSNTLSYASFVRLDLNAISDEERLNALVASLQKRKIRIIGTGVEDPVRREIAQRNAIDLFKGFYFLKPRIVPRRQASPLTFSYMELIARLNAKNINFSELEETIKSDISLSTQLLKYLNTPALGLREKVTSLHQALVLLGENEIRKWASSLIIGNLANACPDHLNTLSLVRARFCESLAEHRGRTDELLDHYLVGLLSLLDVITHQPLDELTLTQGIKPAVRLALLGSRSDLGQAIALTRACERGDAVAASAFAGRLGIDHAHALALYNQALVWGEQLHHGTRNATKAA
ncbi:EAL and HDOD domain-containing protein [Mucisphaera calidilacus]|uniref:HDOD domain protein n=1 Tax=Mucisphaera calidilacus TaxID=2527982 RepID=A0A518BZE4_9BACT|nr:HDOD domain-containing protein [Mucisphaera calidilacus]QDU72338.1 HDOD domain protein [Mucisphaera calidilacus]